MSKSEPKSSGYYAIPKEIFEDPNLADAEKLLIGLIADHSGIRGYCFAGNEYIAQKINKKPKTVSRLITKLCKRGLIRRQILRDPHTQVITERRIFVDASNYIPATNGILEPVPIEEDRVGDFYGGGSFERPGVSSFNDPGRAEKAKENHSDDQLSNNHSGYTLAPDHNSQGINQWLSMDPDLDISYPDVKSYQGIHHDFSINELKDTLSYNGTMMPDPWQLLFSRHEFPNITDWPFATARPMRRNPAVWIMPADLCRFLKYVIDDGMSWKYIQMCFDRAESQALKTREQKRRIYETSAKGWLESFILADVKNLILQDVRLQRAADGKSVVKTKTQQIKENNNSAIADFLMG